MNSDDLDIPAERACTEYRERVSAAHDAEHVEEGAWRRHALACPACRTYESRLGDAASDLAVLRGTPVADLWPALSARTSRARTRSSWNRFGAPVGALAAGALVTWMLLGFLTRRAYRDRDSDRNVERALAGIATAGTAPDELARLDGTPELRLLAYLEAAKENDR